MPVYRAVQSKLSLRNQSADWLWQSKVANAASGIGEMAPVAVPCVRLVVNDFVAIARLGFPISSLPLKRLRQLSTPAHAYAPLHLPQAARSNAAAATRSARFSCHRQRSHRSPFPAPVEGLAVIGLF